MNFSLAFLSTISILIFGIIYYYNLVAMDDTFAQINSLDDIWHVTSELNAASSYKGEKHFMETPFKSHMDSIFGESNQESIYIYSYRKIETSGAGVCWWHEGRDQSSAKPIGLLFCKIEYHTIREYFKTSISWLEPGIRSVSNGLIISSTTSFTHASLKITKGLSFFGEVGFNNQSYIPIPVQDSQLYLGIHVPEKHGFIDPIAPAVSLIVRQDSINWDTIHPFQVSPHNSDHFVSLHARRLKQVNHPRFAALGDSLVFDDSGCPTSYKNINGKCWAIGFIPEVNVFEKFSQSFTDDHTETAAPLKDRTSTIVFFRGITKQKSGNQKYALRNINVYLKQVGKKSMHVVVKRTLKAELHPHKIVQYQTNIGGVLAVDFPDLVDSLVYFRTDFMKKGKWKLVRFKDVWKRIANADEKTLQEAVPKQHKEHVKVLQQGVRQILNPALDSFPAVLSKDSSKSRHMPADGEIHEDDHARVNLVFKRSVSYPKHWKMTFSDTGIEYKETNHLKKRNWLRDKTDDAVERFRDFKEEMMDNIFDAASRADSFMVEKSEDDNGVMSLIVKCVHTAVKSIVTVVVKTFQDAINFVKGIFHRIQTSIHDVIQKVRALFDFDDIKNTGRFLAHHMKNMVKTIDSVLDERQRKFDEVIQKLHDNINEKFDNLLEKFEGKTFETLSSQNQILKNGEHQEDVQGLFVQNALLDQFKPGTGTDQPSHLSKSLDMETQELSEDILKGINSAIPQPKQEEVARKFRNEMTTFQGGFMGLTIAKFLKFIQNTLNLAIDCFKAVRTLLTKYLKKIFKMFDRIMSYRFKLPFITKFFENTIMKGKASLTFYNLFALLGAVPATVTYKRLYGRTPLSVAVVDVLAKTENMNDYIKNVITKFGLKDHNLIQETATAMSHCIGFVYVSTSAIYSATSFMNQLTMWPFRLIQGYFLGLLQYVLQITSVPFNWELDYKSLSFKVRNQVWAYSLLSFLFHKGNPTLPALFVPPMINALFQTILAVPKLALLVLSLSADMKTIEELPDEKKDGRAAEAISRYIAYTSSTLAQMLEWFILPMNPGLKIFPLKNFYFSPAQFAWFFVFPPVLAKTIVLSVGQNLLLWFSTSLHALRLAVSVREPTPFLN